MAGRNEVRIDPMEATLFDLRGHGLGNVDQFYADQAAVIAREADLGDRTTVLTADALRQAGLNAASIPPTERLTTVQAPEPTHVEPVAPRWRGPHVVPEAPERGRQGNRLLGAIDKYGAPVAGTIVGFIVLASLATIGVREMGDGAGAADTVPPATAPAPPSGPTTTEKNSTTTVSLLEVAPTAPPTTAEEVTTTAPPTTAEVTTTHTTTQEKVTTTTVTIRRNSTTASIVTSTSARPTPPPTRPPTTAAPPPPPPTTEAPRETRPLPPKP